MSRHDLAPASVWQVGKSLFPPRKSRITKEFRQKSTCQVLGKLLWHGKLLPARTSPATRLQRKPCKACKGEARGEMVCRGQLVLFRPVSRIAFDDAAGHSLSWQGILPRPWPVHRRLPPLAFLEAPAMFRQHALPQVLLVLLTLLGSCLLSSRPAFADFQITPPAVTLDGNFARTQLVVTQRSGNPSNERAADLTHRARYVSSDPRIVQVSETGLLLAGQNGSATISVRVAETAHDVPVTVKGVVARPAVGFKQDVMPVLTKAGCNAGACHASQYGKGGFKLSVFGFASEEDYHAIVRDGFGRRADTKNPAASLLLRKPTGGVPHEGGQRLHVGSIEYQILEQWLAHGAPPPSAAATKVRALQVYPLRRVGPLNFTQQLQVQAEYSDGRKRDVTALAKFESRDEGVLSISPQGLLTTLGRGQGVALVRFEEQTAIVSVVVPYADSLNLDGWVDNNYIDRLAAAKFREIGISPSPLCDDATFLRRAYLDVTGTLPTPEQAASFLDSKSADKRTQLIDALLGLTGDPSRDVHNNAYAAFWAMKWADLIRSNSTALGEQGMWALHNWLTESFRDNKPFDRFVRELIAARGSTFSNGPANYYRIAATPEDRTEATAQVFLGIRLQCAKCHHHPYETLGQEDYYSFAAFFARVGSKGSPDFGLFGNETVIVVNSSGEIGHPRTGAVMKPTPLHGKPVPESRDRRQALATWLTSPKNPYFARNIVNRYTAYLLGRGLVEPIDDLRATNPPSNPALMDALADDFIKSGYNVKHLLRAILRSRLYQLDSQPTPGNAAESRFYSHYNVKRLAAEPLLDAVDAATGVPTKFEKVPLGTHAIELPDARYNNYFLTTFGKPRREAVCECERVSNPNLAQALHTLNGDVLAAKIANAKGRVARLLAAKKPHDDIVRELYLATLCRRPDARERTAWQKHLAESPDAKTFYEDLLWSLLNSKHFLFVR
jgi:hypothetical protein